MVTPDDSARVRVAVQSVVIGIREGVLVVMLASSGSSSSRIWQLPAGLMFGDESLDESVLRQLSHAGVSAHHVEQLCTWLVPMQDARNGSTTERLLTVSYYVLMNIEDAPFRHNGVLAWFPIRMLPDLQPDHAAIIARAFARLRDQARWTPVGVELLPAKFSLTQLQRVYELILGVRLDKRNFRRRVLATKLLVETHEVEQGVQHRAARLYRFDRARYDRLGSQRWVSI